MHELKVQNKDNGVLSIAVDTEIGYFGINAKSFIDTVKNSGTKKIDITVNSAGGSVFDAFAIYDHLTSPSNNYDVNVTIQGIAASAATIIASADRKKPKMSENSFYMIHNPSLGVGLFTDMQAEDLREMAKDFENTADFLDSIKSRLVAIYQQVTGLSKKKIVEMMDEETWFTAEEAAKSGFVNSDIIKGMKVAAMADSETLKKYGYAKAPNINNKNSQEMEIKEQIAELWKAVKNLGKQDEQAPKVVEVKILDNEEVKNKIAAIEESVSLKDAEIEILRGQLQEKENTINVLNSEKEELLDKVSKLELNPKTAVPNSDAGTEPKVENNFFKNWATKRASR